MKWPAISGLKSHLPQCHITWIAGRRASAFCGPFAELANGTIDEAIEFANLGIGWKELLGQKPVFTADIVISTEPKLRDAVLARRIAHNRFISPAASYFLSDVKPATRSRPVSVVARLQQLFELAIGEPIELIHQLPVSEKYIQQASEVLDTSKTYVGLSPGAGGKMKQWPLENFLALASEQKNKGRIPVFFLGPEEEHMLKEIRTHVPNAIFPEFDNQGRRRAGALFSIALAKFMRVSVANDAGGGHLLSAGGRSLVTLYGHTNSEKFRPSYGPHCAINARTFGSQKMSAIPVSTVLDAMEHMLG